MGIIKAVVGMTMEIVLNSNGEVVGITEGEDLLDFLEDTGGRGGGGSEDYYFQQLPSYGLHC